MPRPLPRVVPRPLPRVVPRPLPRVVPRPLPRVVPRPLPRVVPRPLPRVVVPSVDPFPVYVTARIDGELGQSLLEGSVSLLTYIILYSVE